MVALLSLYHMAHIGKPTLPLINNLMIQKRSLLLIIISEVINSATTILEMILSTLHIMMAVILTHYEQYLYYAITYNHANILLFWIK